MLRRGLSFMIGLTAISIASLAIFGFQLSINDFIDPKIKFNLPPNAIPLRTANVFPNEKDEENGISLGHAQSMAVDANGLFYIPDDRNDEVLVFSKEGRLAHRFGRAGQGPGDFLRPTGIGCGPDYVLVRESQNMRFQFFSLTGKYQSGFRPSQYYDPFLVMGKTIIAAEAHDRLPNDEKNSSLITILDSEGRIQRRFGSVSDGPENDFANSNRTCIALTKNNKLAVAFCFVPIIRLYTLDGKLFREIKTKSGIIDKFTPLDKTAINQLKTAQNSPRGFLANAIFADENGIYIAIAAATRIEILLLDDNGDVKEYYYKNLEAWLGCSSLYVINEKGVKHFFILRHNPQYAIEELVPGRHSDFSNK